MNLKVIYYFNNDRQKPLKMANSYLKESLEKQEEKLHFDALCIFEKAYYHAEEAIHMADSFDAFLQSMKIKLLCGTMMNLAVDIQGI